MSTIRSVYIVQPIDQGWIIERLMTNIAGELAARGIDVRVGDSQGYSGQDVLFNSRFLTPTFDQRALVNSLFVTHVDDTIKELQLKSSFGRFNSFICMSPHDAEFAAALKGDATGIVGIELPARDAKVRPLRIAMFSARYEDGRKNEDWITDYLRARSSDVKARLVFCFMGWGWEKFGAELGAIDANYELYRYSRFVPSEYEMYKQVLTSMDCLIYAGFDGGAMSVYDALNAGIEVIAPNVSYHRNLGDAVTLFDDKDGFFAQLDRLAAKCAARAEALERRSLSLYVDRLLAHWNSLIGRPMQPSHAGANAMASPASPAPPPATQTLREFRQHYKRMGLSRIRSAAIRLLQSFYFR